MRKIYTDGACSGNPGEGGWGIVIVEDGTVSKVAGGYNSDTTNNRMELQAAIRALEFAQNWDEFEIHTDSKYVRNGITKWIKTWKENGWQTSSKNDVKNKDLWKELDELNNEKVEWYYVPGHSGVKMNEIADDIATNIIEYNQEDKDE